MDAHWLVDTTVTPGLPAPAWFILLFKVLGFSLHAVPMNLWYAGVVLSMGLYAAGSQHGRRFAARLMIEMPVVISVGINLGIVPLLFIQVAYAKFFYPATILMAWFWMAIIGLLIFAYYGVYHYAFGLRKDPLNLPLRTRAAGWIAALALLGIGFLFANGMSLMSNVAGWPGLWQTHSVAGAPTGTALNLGDASLWPRWLMLFGLALTTTAAWVVVDAGWFARRETDEYRAWAPGFAWKLQTVGLCWFAVAGTWYLITWPAEVRASMLRGPWVVLTILTALSPGLPWLLLFLVRNGKLAMSRGTATLVGLAQFGVLGINAVSRQLKQEILVGNYFDMKQQPLDVQWSPIVAFLVVTVIGVAVVAWMIAQIVKVPPEKSAV